MTLTRTSRGFCRSTTTCGAEWPWCSRKTYIMHMANEYDAGTYVKSIRSRLDFGCMWYRYHTSSYMSCGYQTHSILFLWCVWQWIWCGKTWSVTTCISWVACGMCTTSWCETRSKNAHLSDLHNNTLSLTKVWFWTYACISSTKKCYPSQKRMQELVESIIVNHMEGAAIMGGSMGCRWITSLPVHPTAMMMCCLGYTQARVWQYL